MASSNYNPNFPTFKQSIVSSQFRDQWNAIANNNLGDEEPPTPVEGMYWLDDAVENNAILKLRYNSIWHELFDEIDAVDSNTDPVVPALAARIKPRYTHTQGSPSTTWVVEHLLLNQYPLYRIVNGSDEEILHGNITSITYDSDEQFTIVFTGSQSGKVLVY